MELSKNAERFKGFADIYDDARPTIPGFALKTIVRYLGYKPEVVVDLGCGTGLSTTMWANCAKEVIGVEPSFDMLSVAMNKQNETIRFVGGYGHDTGLGSDFADVVVCSQSFHWMEPHTTLAEVNRILKDGGVFAAIDCDWPPVSLWQAEKAYEILYDKVKSLEAELPDVKSSFIRYNKSAHLGNIKSSSFFRYSREVLFSGTELCNAERFINIIMSQGSLQSVLKKRPDLISDDIEKFSSEISRIFNTEVFEIDFSYRMRIAVK